VSLQSSETGALPELSLETFIQPQRSINRGGLHPRGGFAMLFCGAVPSSAGGSGRRLTELCGRTAKGNGISSSAR